MHKIFKFHPPEYYSQIDTVHLVGSFNNWNRAQMPMHFNDKDRTWTYEIDLPEGNYAYKFLINGIEWLHDPRAQLYRQNEVGSLDSVAIISETGGCHGRFSPLAPTLDDKIVIYSEKPACIMWSLNGWHPSAQGYLRDDIPNLEVNTQKMGYNPEKGCYEVTLGPFNKRKIPEVIVYSFIFEDGSVDDNNGFNYWLPVDLKIKGKCFVDSFKSNALQSDKPYRIYLPAAATASKSCPLLVMLHGYGGTHLADWTQADTVKMLADRYGIVVLWVDGNVFAWGESIPSWYINSPIIPFAQTEDYIIKELIPHVESQYNCNGTRFVGGISMGGFGAFYLAIKYGGFFKAASSFSAIYSLYKYRRIDALKKLVGGDENWQRDMYNAIKMVKDCHNTDFYFIVGDEERGALRDNFSMKLAMEKYGITNEFRIYPGDHTNNFWRIHIQGMMEFFIRHVEIS